MQEGGKEGLTLELEGILEKRRGPWELQELEVAPNGGDWAILLRQQQHRRGKGLGKGMFSGGFRRRDHTHNFYATECSCYYPLNPKENRFLIYFNI
jgi:hypothetical protein